MTSSVAPRGLRSARQRWSPALYIAPLVVGAAIFTLWPIINVVWLSFQNDYQVLKGTSDGIGVAAYLEVITDPRFHKSVINTAIYTAVVVPGTLIIGLAFAWLLNRPLVGRRLWQILYFLPLVTSVIAIGFAWRWIFDARSGILNIALGWLGIPGVDWLNDANWGMFALIIFGIWCSLPLTTVLLMVGMQNIDPLFSHAARVDGAGPWAIFRKITLPLLARTIGLVLVLNFITSTLVFDQLFPLFNGKPGVAGSLYTVVYYIYESFYLHFDLSRAAAAAVLFSFVVLVLTLIQLRLQRGKGPRT